jgi:hypothetical protein
MPIIERHLLGRESDCGSRVQQLGGSVFQDMDMDNLFEEMFTTARHSEGTTHGSTMLS